MNIIIKTIPHKNHRYETVGDYWFDPDGTLQVRVSDCGHWKEEFLVALHELVEVALCKDRGIQEPDIAAFDIEFEKQRVTGNTDEPGDDPNAPYAKEHRFAENLERLMAHELKINWNQYDDDLCKIWNH